MVPSPPSATATTATSMPQPLPKRTNPQKTISSSPPPFSSSVSGTFLSISFVCSLLFFVGPTTTPCSALPSKSVKLCGNRLLDMLADICDHCYKIAGPSVKINLGQNEKRSLATGSRHQLSSAAAADFLSVVGGLNKKWDTGAGDGAGAVADADEKDYLELELLNLRKRTPSAGISDTCCKKGCSYSYLSRMCCQESDQNCSCTPPPPSVKKLV